MAPAQGTDRFRRQPDAEAVGRGVLGAASGRGGPLGRVAAGWLPFDSARTTYAVARAEPFADASGDGRQMRSADGSY